MNNKVRESGILLPIFSLPNKYGIGSFGKSAYDYVDFLNKSNIKYWQVLPLGPTSYGDSPYQSFSSYAGNPYFIDLEILVKDGLLNEFDIQNSFDDSNKINYERLYLTRFDVLKKAYANFNHDEMNDFVNNNSYWLNDYALFMTIKDSFNGKSFLEWDDNYKFKNNEVINNFIKDNNYNIDFYKFIQFEFYKQYFNLKEYANKNNVQIIGDMPIYVAIDSCDVWSNKEEFLLDEHFNPTVVGGVPPDYFAVKGQLWGNPLYNYDYMKNNDYKWWVNRFRFNSTLFDVIRIDHFRGFESFYAIPYGSSDAVNGKWIKGPGIDLFKTCESKLGKLNIIAENLGLITEEVKDLIKETTYPGMNVLEFGFDPNSDNAIYNLEYNNVVYTGTHDNEPVVSWYQKLSDSDKEYVNEVLFENNPYEICNAMIRACLASVCKCAIIPMWDYLQKDSSARINTPSILGNNWSYRIEYGDMNDDLASYINHLQKIYYRNQN